jgi:hypothetical protein
VGDLIVTSTQKELPVKEALLESNEYGNGGTEYISGPVPTSPTADKPPELVSSDDDDDDDDDDDAEPGDDNPHRRKSIEELLQFIKERSYDSLQPEPPVTKLVGMESSVGTHIDKSKIFNTVEGYWKCTTPAEHVTKNSTLEGYSYDQSTDKQIVYGKRNELPDKTVLDAMETVATISHSNQDDSMATEYLSDAIPASPTEHVLRPKTRLRAKLDAIVIPEPCTDIPSETEENTVKPQGRPARRSSATARA